MEGSLRVYERESPIGPFRSYNLPHPPPPSSSSSSQTSNEFVIGSSAECDLVINKSNWEPKRLVFTWHFRHSTWVVKNLSIAPLFVDSMCLRQGQKMPLLMWEAALQSEGVTFLFQRRPATPGHRGKMAVHIPLTKAGLVIGRGSKNKDGSDTPRVELDPDMVSIASCQAQISHARAGYFLVNHNASPTGRTVLNGDQNFDERKLVLGDCIQIPNCDYYTFKFTGDRLTHLGLTGTLEARDLTVDVPRGRILHPVSLEVPRGGFLGIIGGSGQGKSTLMNALCGIAPATHGQVAVGGAVLRSPRDFARAGIGYVPQDDIVHKELTVEDALSYAARLRLRATRRQIRDVLETTMDILRLSEHRRKRITMLSGGQRKRVSIASELLTSPDFLFLDEPTSGLDPQTERALVGELSMLAQRKRMGVVSTTHVLQNCHVLTRLAFISRGRVIFHGKPLDAVRFFLYSGSPQGAAEHRQTQQTTAVSSGTGSATSTSSRAPGASGSEHHEFTEADLLGKIARIYDIAQDPTKPIKEQDAEAEAWEREYQQSAFHQPAKILGSPGPDGAAAAATPAPPARTARAGILRSLFLLLSRQWRILTSSSLNYLFLAAQAMVIGFLIGWVSENPVLQLFLCVIATLWFGCSNGAQQIVAEMAIFRRERLAGLGIQTYLLSKFLFLTTITGLQALGLYFVMLCASHQLHPPKVADQEQAKADFTGTVPDKATREFRKSFFDAGAPWDGNMVVRGLEDDPQGAGSSPDPASAAPPGGAAAPAGPSKDSAFSVDGFTIVEQEGIQPLDRAGKQQIEINPTGLHVRDWQYGLMERLAGYFRVRQNILDTLAVRHVQLLPGQSASLFEDANGSISWSRFMATLIGLRLGALLGAALVGVALGLGISALVRTPTQAVMWVPLILIPQILFGAFVVVVPEMEDGVLAFSSLLPSFNLQRLMDVSLLYGCFVPRMSNQTKIPAFLDEEDEEVKWTSPEASPPQGKAPPENTTFYQRVSDLNKSWQNLVVSRSLLGQREKVLNAGGTTEDTVPERRDVSLSKSQHGRYDESHSALEPARTSAAILAAWVLASYLIAAFSLSLKQTGR
jgi:ABC transport system ATP-binding/permease protein